MMDSLHTAMNLQHFPDFKGIESSIAVDAGTGFLAALP